MKSGGGGIRRLAPLLLVSLLLHLAVFFAASGSYRQESAGRHMPPNLTVTYLEPGQDHENHPRTASPGPVAESEPRHSIRHESRLVTPSVTQQSRMPGTGAVPSSAPIQEGGAVRDVSRSIPSLTEAAPAATANTGNREMSPGTGLAGRVTGAGSGGASGVGSVTGAGRNEGSGPGGGQGIDPAGMAGGSSQRRTAYQDLVKRLIEAHKEYPFAARRSRHEGSCRRRFVLDRNGTIRLVELLSSCGHALLDEAATRAIMAVGAFPPLPDDFRGAEEAFTISMTFTLSR